MTSSIDLAQKVVEFKVYHGVDFAYSWFSTDYAGMDSYMPTVRREKLPAEETFYKTSYILSKERPFVYWITLVACVILILVFLLFATYCIVRNNHKSAKMREELRFLGHSEYTLNNKRSVIYLTNPKVPKNTKPFSGMGSIDRSVLTPLKPDNIREHQDYSFVHYNQTKCSPSNNDSAHYTNINFGSPSSILMNGAAELFDPTCQHQSFDEEPIQSSPIESSTESDDGMKSFDENIAEYQDPELVDLRAPGQKK